MWTIYWKQNIYKSKETYTQKKGGYVWLNTEIYQNNLWIYIIFHIH